MQRQTVTTPALDDGERASHSPFPIVGVGASAGGLEAFRQLLTELPDEPTGMAFLLVQHLDPHYESRLTDLLAKYTRMHVVEAAHGVRVEPDHVYVIAPNTSLSIAQGVLEITPRAASRPHLAVDHLFHSLAEEQQARSIGVVLSGTGSDGTRGLCEIKAVGGITFAQDEASASQAGMPRSAFESGCVDFVGPVEEIARRLVELSQHAYQRPPNAAATEREGGEQLARILRLVQQRKDVDFQGYRDTTIRRRVLRRMALHGDHTHGDYLRRLAADGSEIDALYHDLLINVTNFFRDPPLFESLKRNVFPEIARGKSQASPIRIWVPGCSTGQEAYSIAMALWEFFDTEPHRPPVQIFATDVNDSASLDRARTGLYPASIEAQVSPERLRRFFTHDGHSYRICKEIRDACIFARQNMISDPPFSHVQLVSCRNVMIYMSTALQKVVLPTFHYALDAPGFLVLGTAESVGPFTDLFDVVDRDHKVYAKKVTASRPPLHFTLGAGRSRAGAERRAAQSTAPEASLQREADRLMLSRYAPAGVVVNENFDIVQFRGQTSAYLEAPPGEPTVNVLRMAREGLLLSLRNALLEAKTRGEPARRQQVRVQGEAGAREIDLQVLPLRPSDAPGAHLLVLFEESGSLPNRQASADAPWRRVAGWLGARSPRQASDRRRERGASEAEPGDVSVLRQELAATKEFLQSLIERQDAANEELRSANEETQSSNEELQSTNEELETAKEELESSNEELSTVNEQLNSRNAELSVLNNDLVNLQNSTTIPVVVLGSDLRIRRFTAPAKQVLKLTPSDIGRPISDLSAPIPSPDLEEMVLEALEHVRAVEREIRDSDGHWYVLRVHPYRTSDNRIDGAVVVLIDVDQVKSAERALQAAADYAKAIVDTMHEPLIVLDAGFRVQTANRSFYETFAASPSDTQGRLFYELGNQQWDIPELRSLLEHVLPEREEVRNFEVVQTFPEIGARHMLLNARELSTESGHDQILLSFRDVTSDRHAAAALRKADQRKDEFLAILSHELRNPLGTMLNSVELMKLVENTPEPVRKARDLLERSLQLTRRLVEDLLDVSRIAEGKLVLQKQRISLATAVEEAVENTPLLGRSGHELSIDLPTETLWLDADPARLAQAISNLLSNAARFTPDGGQIQLTGEKHTSAEQIVISVRDNGIGIAPDELDQIFGMFQQGGSSLGRMRGGLGVGLALTKQLVELHGGSVVARSAGIGKGSEFVLRLPAAGPPPGPRRPAPQAAPAVGPSRRVLLVDDNLDHAESMKLLLERLGHDVRLVHDGSSVVAAALDFTPHVALVDIGLPDIDGYEVARRLRQQPELEHVMLVAQTGWGRDEDRYHSSEAGFDHHLVKPVEIEDVIKLLALPSAAG